MRESLVAPPRQVSNRTDPYYGVKGWLKFIVVTALYIDPILFVLAWTVAWLGVAVVANDLPGIVPYATLEMLTYGFLVWKWMQIARHLRDIKPGVVQEAKLWLKVAFGWSLVSIMLSRAFGLAVGESSFDGLQSIFNAVIGYGIWYWYFCVSKRVKATYPDWDK